MGNQRQLHSKWYHAKRVGLSIKYLRTLTDEGETIKGLGLFRKGKLLITFALASGAWTDDNKIPHGFKLIGRVLFIGRLAIGSGKGAKL